MKSGRSPSIAKIARSELGKRDRLILADVIRYRLTTNEFLHRRFLAHAQMNAVVKVTGRLVRQGWLAVHLLLDRQQYFVAGTRLIKLHGLPISRTRPFGPQALITNYAVAKYCFTNDLPVTLADEHELLAAFPWIKADLICGIQLLENSGPHPTLRLLRVDLGGTPEHITKKCVHDLTNRQKFPQFNELVAQKRFVLVVLVASTAKQELIQQAMSKRQWPRGMRVQIFVIPEMAQFISFN